MPIKRLNFTNRVKLTREQANVSIHPGDPASFDAVLELSHLPASAATARVFIEAYHRTTRMRFDYGTVASLTPPPPAHRLLKEFDDWKDVSFRIKVTNVTDAPGLILAWANSIQPKGPDDQPHNDLVRWRDAELDGRLWDIEFDESGPVILVEKQVGHSNVGQDAHFIAAAYPEILRRSLEKALIHDRTAAGDDDHWFYSWNTGYLQPTLKLGEIPDANDQDALRDWIEEAVVSFGRKFRPADSWLKVAGVKGAD